jgi:GNAT superfamily N-acetyltransferase
VVPDPTQLVHESFAALADLSDVGGLSAVVAGVPCCSVPEIPFEWATQARAVGSAQPPPAAVVGAVRDWLAAHAPTWTLVVRGEHAGALPGWHERYLLRGFHLVTGAQPAPRPPAELSIGPAADAAEFLSVFGAELAALVTDRHLRSATRHHLVARLAGVPVGCARVQECRLPGGTRVAHLSGVAVLPAARGRGVGSALSSAATELARARADLVWLHATEQARPIYERLGFRHLADHAQLGPPS